MQESKVTQRIRGLPPVAYMLVALTVIFGVMSPDYFTLMDFKNVLIQTTPSMIVAFGQICIVLTQGTDLFLGAQISSVTVFTVWMALRRAPFPAAMPLAVLSTTLIGVMDGVIVVKGSISPLIVTHRMQNTLNSLSLLLTAGSSIYFQSSIYRTITETIIPGIPLMVRAAILVFVVVWVVLSKTRSGANIHGLGGNRKVLQLVGINPTTCLIRTYVPAEFIVGTAGVVTLNRTEAGVPTTATGWEFQAVTVILLGGTSLREGEGDVTGTILDTLLIRVIKNELNIVGVQLIKQNAIIGPIVPMVIIVDAVVRTRSKEQGDRDMKAERIFEEIRDSKIFYSLIGSIMLVVFSATTTPSFRTVDSTIIVLRQTSILLVPSVELTAMFLTGGMDLSVGAIAGFIGRVYAQCIRNGVPTLAAFILGILIGLVAGAINELLAGVLPGFIATYGTSWVMSGLAALVMQGAVIYDPPKGFTRIGVGYTGPVLNLIIIATVVVALIYILLQKTTYGRQVYAYGSNLIAAKYVAVLVKKIMLLVSMTCSVCTGLAGMLMTTKLNMADAAMEDSYGLQTVAAVMVGGTSTLGGKGGILGTVAGVLILTIIVNVTNLKGISSYAQGLVIGIVIIATVLLDTYSERRQESKVI